MNSLYTGVLHHVINNNINKRERLHALISDIKSYCILISQSAQVTDDLVAPYLQYLFWGIRGSTPSFVLHVLELI